MTLITMVKSKSVKQDLELGEFLAVFYSHFVQEMSNSPKKSEEKRIFTNSLLPDPFV